MGFAEDLRKSHQPETDESKKEKHYEELNEAVERMTRYVINTVKQMAKAGHYQNIDNKKRRIHFYLGIGLSMDFRQISQGMGFFKNSDEKKYEITINLANKDLQYVFNTAKKGY